MIHFSRERKRGLISCLFVTLGAVAPPPAKCEATQAAAASREYQGTAAFSFFAGGGWGTVPLLKGVRDDGRGTATLELQFRKTLARRGRVVFDYVAAVVPVELAVGTIVEEASPLRGTPASRSTVYGGGVDPAGFEVRFGEGTWRPFGALRGGLRLFEHNVPVPGGTRFNFSADIGLGVCRRLGGSRWASIGVDVHHVSNGGLGEHNPSINLFMLSVGLGLR